MRIRRTAMVAALVVGATTALGASAGAATHTAVPWTSVTLSSHAAEVGDTVVAKFCWHNAPIGWIAQLSTGDNPGSTLTVVYSAKVAGHNRCIAPRVPVGPRGIHPYSGQLLTGIGASFATAAVLQYVYAPTAGSVFLPTLLYPHCNGKGEVTIAGARHAFTCAKAAVTSQLTKTPTSCRHMTFVVASTDRQSGDASSPGASIFELAQNSYAPTFARFHDNVIVHVAIPTSGSAFWVAFKSTHPQSRMYFLDQGAVADCYTANGKP